MDSRLGIVPPLTPHKRAAIPHVHAFFCRHLYNNYTLNPPPSFSVSHMSTYLQRHIQRPIQGGLHGGGREGLFLLVDAGNPLTTRSLSIGRIGGGCTSVLQFQQSSQLAEKTPKYSTKNAFYAEPLQICQFKSQVRRATFHLTPTPSGFSTMTIRKLKT